MMAVLGLRLNLRVRQRKLELLCRSSDFVRNSVVTEYGSALYSGSGLLSSRAEVTLLLCEYNINCTILRREVLF